MQIVVHKSVKLLPTPQYLGQPTHNSIIVIDRDYVHLAKGSTCFDVDKTAVSTLTCGNFLPTVSEFYTVVNEYVHMFFNKINGFELMRTTAVSHAIVCKQLKKLLQILSPLCSELAHLYSIL